MKLNELLNALLTDDQWQNEAADILAFLNMGKAEITCEITEDREYPAILYVDGLELKVPSCVCDRISAVMGDAIKAAHYALQSPEEPEVK